MPTPGEDLATELFGPPPGGGGGQAPPSVSYVPGSDPAYGGSVEQVDYQPAQPVSDGGGGGALVPVTSIVPSAGANLSKPAIRRFAAIAASVPGPWRPVFAILSLALASEVGEWLITKAWEAISGVFTGSGSEPGDTGRGNAIWSNVKDPNAAARIINTEINTRAEQDALAFILSGWSKQSNPVEFLELSAGARKYVRFVEIATDGTIMSILQVRAQNSGFFQARNTND